jgi:hypothetical protein
MSVKYTDNTSQIMARIRRGTNIGLRQVAEEIFRVADPKTPKKHGNLRRDKIIRVLGLQAILQWDKKYAALQEDTQYRHYTTEGTGPYFAANAVREVIPRSGRILKRAYRSV